MRRHRAGLLLWACASLGSLGCQGPRSAAWWLEFGSSGLSSRASTLEASILVGGCDGTSVAYSERFAVGTTPRMPTTLGPGSYGFVARARDADCRWFAYGCTDVTLPAAGVTVTMNATAEELDAACASGDAGPFDAGITDVGPRDAAPPTLVPSNVPSSLFDDGGSVVLADGTLDTDDCTSLPGTPILVDQTGGPQLCVLRATDVTIPSDVTVRVIGGHPLVILALGTVRIDGVLDAAAHGTTPGPGGGTGGTLSNAATGTNAGADGMHIGTYDDGGGGGGGACGVGSAGGRGDSAEGGPASTATESASMLVPLRGGSGGGRGGSGESRGLGGAGGGGLQITAGSSIGVDGTILVSGGGGRGGLDGTSGDVNIGAGGGGGSGGLLLLESPTITIGTSARLWAAGGGGGGGSGCRNAGNGVDGEDGRDTSVARPAGGARGPTCDTFNVGAPGGVGGGGTDVVGTEGSDLDSDAGSGANGGGGGGGAGCILLRNATGTLPAGIGASPSVTPGLRAATVMTL